MTEGKQGSRMLSAQQVADELGVSARTVKRQCERGELPGTRVGRQWRIPEWAVYGTQPARPADRLHALAQAAFAVTRAVGRQATIDALRKVETTARELREHYELGGRYRKGIDPFSPDPIASKRETEETPAEPSQENAGVPQAEHGGSTDER